MVSTSVLFVTTARKLATVLPAQPFHEPTFERNLFRRPRFFFPISGSARDDFVGLSMIVTVSLMFIPIEQRNKFVLRLCQVERAKENGYAKDNREKY
jgi:hypothetical protein